MPTIVLATGDLRTYNHIIVTHKMQNITKMTPKNKCKQIIIMLNATTRYVESTLLKTEKKP